MMTDRPTAFPDWATDETYSSGPDSGLPTKLEPTSGEKASGYIRGQRPPARKMNWQFGVTGKWIRHLDGRANMFARASLIEPKGTPPTLWGNAESIAWCEASNGFASLDAANGLKFFSGANTALSDGVAIPTDVAQTGHLLVASKAGTIVVCRSFGSSAAHRLTRWNKTAGTFTTPAGLPNGTVRPVAVWIRSDLFLVTDGANAYTLDGSTLTAVTAPGITAAFAASNGSITVVANTIGGVRASANDGSSWSASVLTSAASVTALAWFPRIGKFVALGSTSGADRTIHTSPDGVNWTEEASALRTHRGMVQTLRIYRIAVAAGGHMLVGHGYETGSGAYAGQRALLYSFDAVTWHTWDVKVAGDTAHAIAAGPSQVAVLYPSGVVRLFGAG